MLLELLILETSHIMTLEVDPDDIRTVPQTYIAEGTYEPLLSQILFRFASRVESFVDVGANIGYYSIATAILNPHLKITAFEPNPLVARRLRENLKLNSCQNRVNAVPLALSDRVENDVELFIPLFTGSGGGSMADLHPDEGNSAIHKVSTSTLDYEMRHLGGLDLIKIDVEGAEFGVLQGAFNTIKKYRPTIIVELLRKWMTPFGHHPQDFVNELTKSGYVACSISDTQCQRIYQITDETIETNFVFCHPSRSEDLAFLDSL